MIYFSFVICNLMTSSFKAYHSLWKLISSLYIWRGASCDLSKLSLDSSLLYYLSPPPSATRFSFSFSRGSSVTSPLSFCPSAVCWCGDTSCCYLLSLRSIHCYNLIDCYHYTLSLLSNTQVLFVFPSCFVLLRRHKLLLSVIPCVLSTPIVS